MRGDMSAPPVAADFNSAQMLTGVSALTAEGQAITQSVAIIGGGPSGLRLAQELSRRGISTTVFNAERWAPYNRVKLTPLLSGDVQIGQVLQPLVFPGPGHVDVYSDRSVVDVDRSRKTISDKFGRVWPYAKLVFCTGSRAHVPPIPGHDLPGVFTFRNFDDVEKLVARSFRSRRTIVIGGGLLGLEAARGMTDRGTETWVIEHERHLLARQLDEHAGQLLAQHIDALGIRIRTGQSVARIEGRDRVEGLELSGGERIACDTVILCTGVRANMELARDIGLAVGRGIKVSATLQTADPDIYAVGECAEFESHVCGLVGPAFEQAAIAAAHIAGETVAYSGSVPATKLKVVGIDVLSIGDVEQIEQRTELGSLSFEHDDRKIYRRLIVSRGRLVGAVAIGDWAEINRLQEAVRSRQRLWPWQRVRFWWKGDVWAKRAPASVREWPRAATVCNCTGVTRGQIGDAISLGCATIADVRRDTGASTVCGSCGPLIEELLGAPPKRQPVRLFKPIATASAIAGVLALVTFLAPAWPTARNIEMRGVADLLWLNGTWKQVSGYMLLALSVAAAVLSLRKRAIRFGDFANWRVVHVAVGVATLLTLFLHTGFRLGSNLNKWLMLSFLFTAFAGAAAGLATALEHRLLSSQRQAARSRALTFSLHILALWPLPLLLTAHVLCFYFY
jgi:nitrite reductase (NADH) large subunit